MGRKGCHPSQASNSIVLTLGLLQITYVDFLVYDVLDKHRMFEPKCLDTFPNLKDFMGRFEALEKISAYIKSSRFLTGPMYLKMALWGSK